MPGMTKELQTLFYAGRQFMDNAAADPEASALLSARGIDAAKLQGGETLYGSAIAAVADNGTAFATQIQATDDFNLAFDASWEETQDLARILASAYEGQSEELVLLGLHQRRDSSTGASEIAWPQSKALPAYLPWARNFYARLAEGAFVEMAAAFGYPAEEIAAMSGRVEEVGNLDNAQERAKAHTRQSTEDRDREAAAFKAWFGRQKIVARVALKNKKRLLELLGLR